MGSETRHWQTGECLLYDTTYEHETMNEHPTEERVVLHVDFFNTIAMTPFEIEVMQYIYRLREVTYCGYKITLFHINWYIVLIKMITYSIFLKAGWKK